MPKPRGHNIEARRLRLGMKRSELATKVGLHYKTIFGLEKEHQTGSQESFQRIATVLGLELEEVMDTSHAGAA